MPLITFEIRAIRGRYSKLVVPFLWEPKAKVCRESPDFLRFMAKALNGVLYI